MKHIVKEIEAVIKDVGGRVPWVRDTLITVYAAESGYHSRDVCADTREEQVTLETAWELEWAECGWCEGVDGYAPGRDIRAAADFVGVLHRRGATWRDVIHDEGTMWREQSADLSVLRCAALEAHERRRRELIKESNPVDVWGMFCAGSVYYTVTGEKAQAIAAWVRDVSRGAERGDEDAEREFLQSLSKEAWTWGVWMSPASIDERGARARSVAHETRRLEGSAYTISYGLVPEAFLRGLERTGREVAGCQTEQGARLAYMIHQTAHRGAVARGGDRSEGLRAVAEGCEILVARRGQS